MTTKRLISLAGIAILTLAAASCNKEVTTNPIFTATTESDAKTHLGDNGLDLLWDNSGETIAINDGTNTAVYTATSVADNIATFHYTSGDAIADEGPYTVIYPADAYVAPRKIYLPHVQPYSADGLSDYPMYAEATGTELQFKNLCAVLHLSLTKSGKSVRYITVTSNLPMAGNFNIDYNEGNPTLTACGDYSNAAMLTIDCGSTGVDISSGADFYINLPAQTYESELLQIEIIYTDNTVSVKTTNADFPAARGARYDLVYGTADLNNDRTLGLFTINDQGTQVVFSSGNLYYYAKWKTNLHFWRFFSKVSSSNHEYIGESSSFSEYDMEHFLWSTSASGNNFGTNVSNAPDVTGSFVNWGNIFGSAMDWRILTQAEWNYLLNTRTVNNGQRAYAYARVGNAIGIIVFPDNWTGSTAFTLKTDEDRMHMTTYITELDWYDNVEPTGVIFLPGTGYREGTTTQDLNQILSRHHIHITYWSSTEDPNDQTKAYAIQAYAVSSVRNTILTTDLSASKATGRFVRLVRPVNTTTTAK